MTPAEQVRQIAAEHPDSVAAFIEQGKKAGLAEGRKEIMDLLRSNTEAAQGNHELANKATLAGHDPEAVKLAVDAKAKAEAEAKAREDAHKAEIEAKQKEIDRLKFEAGGQKAIGTQANEGKPVDTSDPKAVAEAEWSKDPKIREGFSTKDRYVAVRVAELKGRLKTSA